VRLPKSEFREGLAEAARELSLSAGVQIENHANGTPEQLVLEFDRLDVAENRAHLTPQELVLLDELLSIIHAFSPAARTLNLWFSNEWMHDRCWDPVRVAASALVAEMAATGL